MQTKTNNNVIIVLCLAGLGQRFLDKGYETPKFLLSSKNSQITILELILQNFILSGSNEFILMLNKRHQLWENKINSIAKKLKITFNIEFIEDTRGQAETAYYATEILNNSNNKNKFLDSPIAFHNGDTILVGRDLKLVNKIISKSFDGLIDTFESLSENFSYISTDSNSIVKKIIEKKVISNRATSGFYVFSNFNNYRYLYKKINKDEKELYISDVYNVAISMGQKIFNLHYESPYETIVLGTPVEYEDWLEDE